MFASTKHTNLYMHGCLLTNYSIYYRCIFLRKGYKNRRNIMAEPIRLGLLIDDPEDVREFEENMKNPMVTKEQVEFFKRAIKVYKSQRL